MKAEAQPYYAPQPQLGFLLSVSRTAWAYKKTGMITALTFNFRNTHLAAGPLFVFDPLEYLDYFVERKRFYYDVNYRYMFVAGNRDYLKAYLPLHFLHGWSYDETVQFYDHTASSQPQYDYSFYRQTKSWSNQFSFTGGVGLVLRSKRNFYFLMQAEGGMTTTFGHEEEFNNDSGELLSTTEFKNINQQATLSFSAGIGYSFGLHKKKGKIDLDNQPGK